MLKSSSVFRKNLTRQFSKSDRHKINDFLKAKKLAPDTRKSHKNPENEPSQRSHSNKDPKSMLSSFQRIDMKKLSTEEAMVSPVFEYRNKKNQQEVERLRYENAVKLKMIDDERKQYNLMIAGNTKVDMYIYLKGKDQYNKWMKHMDQVSKVDPAVGILQKRLLENYRYDPVDEFADSKLLYSYPGTSKGPRPEDDPIYFTEWYRRSVSNSAFKFLSTIEKLHEVEIKEENEEKTTVYGDYATFLNSKGFQFPMTIIIDELESGNMNKYGNNGNIETKGDQDTASEIQKTSEELGETGDMDNDYIENQEFAGLDYVIDTPSELPDYLDLPFSELPVEGPIDRNDFMEYSLNWHSMAFCVRMAHLVKNFERVSDETHKLNEERKAKDEYYPSVWGYYELLPNHLKENVLVKSTVLALEKHGYFLTLEEKQQLLNNACRSSLETTEGELKRGHNGR